MLIIDSQILLHSTTNLKQITNSPSTEETHLKHLINSSDCKRVGQSWWKPEGERFSGDRQAVHLALLLKVFTPWGSFANLLAWLSHTSWSCKNPWRSPK